MRGPTQRGRLCRERTSFAPDGARRLSAPSSVCARIQRCDGRLGGAASLQGPSAALGPREAWRANSALSRRGIHSAEGAEGAFALGHCRSTKCHYSFPSQSQLIFSDALVLLYPNRCSSLWRN